MGYAQMERDLAFIKRTMEQATRYDNIPPVGYLITGLLGLVGAGGTFALLGGELAAELDPLDAGQLTWLGVLWGTVLVTAVACLAAAAVLRARRRGIAAWNSLATRMFLSQIPQVIAAGLLTFGLVYYDEVRFVPALWLLHYGVITFSFSYFAGRDHQVVGAAFLVLGAVALFGPVGWAVPLLAVGFGGAHLVLGVARMLRKSKA